MRPLAIYLHVPFCLKKCDYCDFASWPNREREWRRYFDALEAEIRHWSATTDFGLLSEWYYIQTVFFGGGTPTLVEPDDICEVLARCSEIAHFARDSEITIEGNPGTLTPEKLSAYRRAGINRLSIGAQSFDDDLLRSLGRVHTAAQIGEAVQMARAAGFDNINLDLMYALPGQGMEQWIRTLDSAIALGVQHISAYSLIVEPGTPMADRVARGAAIVPDDDAVNAMQRAAVARLQEADYGRYEISNYAKPGFECRHNLAYWHREDYLGLGCAAHSMLQGMRFSNPAGLEDYLSGVRMIDRQVLSREDAIEETVMLSTRLMRGIDLLAWDEAFGEEFMTGRTRVVERLVQAGYVRVVNDRLMLTMRGLEVQDAVTLELLSARE